MKGLTVMGRLRSNLVNTGTIAAGKTTVSVPVNHSSTDQVWVIEQIGATYSVATDPASVAIYVNGSLYAGPAQFIPTIGGQGQSFSGSPFLYAEATDDVEVVFSNGTAGAQVSIQVQYRVIAYSDDELAGRF